MIKKAIILFVLSIEQLLLADSSGIEPHCQYDASSQTLNCDMFNSFGELNFRQSTQIYKRVYITPESKLNLDASLDLTGLQLNNTTPPKIIISNLKGLDPSAPIFAPLLHKQFSLEIADSDWSWWPSPGSCDLAASNQHRLFASLNLDEFKLKNAKFSSPICPLTFQNSKINRLVIEALYPVTFEPVSIDYQMSNITIDELYLEFCYADFIKQLDNDSILNGHLFNQLKVIELKHVIIESIDSASLVGLKNLKQLRLISLNYNELFERGSDWLAALNTYNNNKTPADPALSRSDLFELVLHTNELGTSSYVEFGDNEFCWFKHMRSHNLVVPFFYSNELSLLDELPCSCTIAWLYKDYHAYSHLFNQTNVSFLNLPIINIQLINKLDRI